MEVTQFLPTVSTTTGIHHQLRYIRLPPILPCAGRVWKQKRQNRNGVSAFLQTWIAGEGRLGTQEALYDRDWLEVEWVCLWSSLMVVKITMSKMTDYGVHGLLLQYRDTYLLKGTLISIVPWASKSEGMDASPFSCVTDVHPVFTKET